MDLAFESVGSRGKYQKILAFLVILIAPLSLITIQTFTFMFKRPDFECKIKGDPMDNFNICPEKDLCQNNFFDYKIIESTSLKNWAYEYEIFCSKPYFYPLFLTTFFFGSMIGNPFLLPLADKYGRKTMFNIILIALFVLMLNIYFAINEWHILFANALLGLMNFSSSLSSIIITEFFDRELKSTIISLCGVSNAVFNLLYLLYFLFVKEWRLVFLITSSLTLLLVIISQMFLLESPRWLNSQNKFVETLDVLKEVAKINDNEENFNKFLLVNEGIF